MYFIILSIMCKSQISNWFSNPLQYSPELLTINYHLILVYSISGINQIICFVNDKCVPDDSLSLLGHRHCTAGLISGGNNLAVRPEFNRHSSKFRLVLHNQANHFPFCYCKWNRLRKIVFLSCLFFLFIADDVTGTSSDSGSNQGGFGISSDCLAGQCPNTGPRRRACPGPWSDNLRLAQSKQRSMWQGWQWYIVNTHFY